MFVRGEYTTFSVLHDALGQLSDHSALCATIPWARDSTVHAAGESVVYRWVDGSSLSDYSRSWRAWNEYTDSLDFAAEFDAVIDAHCSDTESLASAVEQFLLRKAVECGVVTR